MITFFKKQDLIKIIQWAINYWSEQFIINEDWDENDVEVKKTLEEIRKIKKMYPDIKTTGDDSGNVSNKTKSNNLSGTAGNDEFDRNLTEITENILKEISSFNPNGDPLRNEDKHLFFFLYDESPLWTPNSPIGKKYSKILTPEHDKAKDGPMKNGFNIGVFYTIGKAGLDAYRGDKKEGIKTVMKWISETVVKGSSNGAKFQNKLHEMSNKFIDENKLTLQNEKFTNYTDLISGQTTNYLKILTYYLIQTLPEEEEPDPIDQLAMIEANKQSAFKNYLYIQKENFRSKKIQFFKVMVILKELIEGVYPSQETKKDMSASEIVIDFAKKTEGKGEEFGGITIIKEVENLKDQFEMPEILLDKSYTGLGEFSVVDTFFDNIIDYLQNKNPERYDYDGEKKKNR